MTQDSNRTQSAEVVETKRLYKTAEPKDVLRFLIWFGLIASVSMSAFSLFTSNESILDNFIIGKVILGVAGALAIDAEITGSMTVFVVKPLPPIAKDSSSENLRLRRNALMAGLLAYGLSFFV